MNKPLMTADASTVDYVKSALMHHYAYSADKATRMVKRYSRAINTWYTDCKNDISRHETLDDIVVGIHMRETFGY